MWRLPTKVIFKDSGLLQLPEIIEQQIASASKASNISSLLIVTDDGLRRSTPWIDKLSNALQTSLACDITIYDSTPVNPRLETVEEIAHISRSKQCDLIVSIGGGSSIDAGKAAAMYAAPSNMKQALRAFAGRPDQFSSDGMLPFVAVPSTCGTGSEVTWVSVLSDTVNERKLSIKGERMYPDIALIDAELLRTLPPQLIACTSMDALTHAMESFVGTRSNEVSDMFAIRAIELIFEYLPRAVHKSDLFARYYIAMASTYAGMAFGSSDVGAVHCLSETLGGMYDIAHGLANSAILYETMRLHQPFIRHKLCRLYRATQMDKKMVYQMLLQQDASVARMEKDEVFLLCLNRLRSEIGNVLQSFHELNVSTADYARIAHECVLNGSNASNPQSMDENSYLALLHNLERDQVEYIKSPCHRK